MNQPPLFVENIYDALKSIVQHLGGAKMVGGHLWPQKSVDDARRLLLDCLNPDRHEKLDPEQVLLLFRLGRDAEFHVAKHWFDREAGYQPAAPLDPREAELQLVRTIDQATATLERALGELQRRRPAVTLTKVA